MIESRLGGNLSDIQKGELAEIIPFCEVIKKARTLLGMTQEEVAKLLGVEQPTISRWEHTEKRPESDEAIRALSLLLYKIAETRLHSLKSLDNISRELQEIKHRLPKKCAPKAKKYTDPEAIALSKLFAKKYTAKTRQLLPDESFGAMGAWFKQVRVDIPDENIRRTIDFFFAYPKRTQFGFGTFRAKFADLMPLAVGQIAEQKTGVAALKSWICPKCGHENRNTGGFCLNCRWDKDDETEKNDQTGT